MSKTDLSFWKIFILTVLIRNIFFLLHLIAVVDVRCFQDLHFLFIFYKFYLDTSEP